MSQIKTKFIENSAVTDAKVATGIDAAKLADGSVSNTELQFINSVTSNVQTQINGKQTTTLASANILVGNGSNVATAVAVSGDVTTDNTGAFTIAANAVGSSKMRLTNAQPLRGRKADNSADVSILEIDASDNVFLLDATGTQASIDITNRRLVNSTNDIIVDFENSIVGNIGIPGISYLNNFKDNSDVSAMSVWNRQLKDTSGVESIVWGTRQLKDANSNVILDYAAGYLADQDPTTPAPALDFGTTALIVKPTGAGAARAIEFQNGAGTFSAAIKAPALTASYTLTLPPNDGAAGEVLRTDGSGVLTWVSNAGITLNRQTFVLDSTDITNQFITLSGTPIANSVTLAIKGAGATIEGASYDFTTTGAQLDFLNDLATAGAAALVVGDVLQVSFAT
jgi:hypothetical protein